MTEQTTSSIAVDAPPRAVMDVIADFPAYPTWAKGVVVAEPSGQDADGRAEQVRFSLDVPPITDDYTLAYTWDDDRRVSWTLVEAGLLTVMDGDYRLRTLDDGRTEVTYRLTVDLSVPLIGSLKRKGEKIIIDTALDALKARVEALY